MPNPTSSVSANRGGSGSGGGGAGHTHGEVYGIHSAGGPLALAVASADTELFIADDDAVGIAVHMFWDANNQVTSVEPNHNGSGNTRVTVQSALGFNGAVGAEVTFNPWVVPAGSNSSTMLMNLLNQPLDIYAWGYLGRDLWSSIGAWVDSNDWWYQCISAEATRVGAYVPTEEEGRGRVGAAIPARGGENYYLFRLRENMDGRLGAIEALEQGNVTENLYIFSLILSH